MDEIRARALIARLPGLTAEQLRPLIAAAGGEPAAILTRRALDAPDLPPAARAFLASPDETALDADLAWVRVSGARILLCTDPEYPPLLAESSGAPASLYVLGSVPALASPQLAMVGSRSPTEAGRLTVAVFGTGLDRVYPAEHAPLAARIREHGALVSEFPPRSAPLAQHFPRRNRIISGLSLGTLIVEAARKSGSLITARLAVEQGREVFAIPGSIHSPVSRGCHQLIREGAKLVEEAADVLTELRISLPKETLTAQRSLPLGDGELDKEYEMLLDALGFEPATIDVLVARTRLGVESVASMLLILELKGRVAALPGGRYGRIP